MKEEKISINDTDYIVYIDPKGHWMHIVEEGKHKNTIFVDGRNFHKLTEDQLIRFIVKATSNAKVGDEGTSYIPF